MAHHYHRRQMRQMAEAQVKAGESESAVAGPSSEDSSHQQNLNNAIYFEDWNPNQIVYRKVSRLNCSFLHTFFFHFTDGICH